MTPEFRRAIFTWNYDSAKDGEEDLCIPLQLQKLFGMLQLSHERVIDTVALTKSFGWEGSEVFQQQDVQELTRVLFDALEDTFRGTAVENIIDDLYAGELVDYIRCLDVDYQSERVDKFLDLSLTIVPFGSDIAMHSISECIEMYLRPEILDGENQYYAEKFDRKVDAIKGLKFGRLPQIMAIQLKRFVFDFTGDNIVHKKLNDQVKFPMVLDMNKYVATRRRSRRPKNGSSESERDGATEAAMKEGQERAREEEEKEKEEEEEDEKGGGIVMEPNMEFEAFLRKQMDRLKNSRSETDTEAGTEADAEGVAEAIAVAEAAAGAAAEAVEATSTAQKYNDPEVTGLAEVQDATSSPSASFSRPRLERRRSRADSTVEDADHGVVYESLEPGAIREMLRTRGEWVYELYAVLIHSGAISGGHYYAYIKDLKSKQWFNFNDSSVSPIDEEVVKEAWGAEQKQQNSYGSSGNFGSYYGTSIYGGGYSSYGRSSYSSSANAYMLMYRKITLDNLKRPAGGVKHRNIARGATDLAAAAADPAADTTTASSNSSDAAADITGNDGDNGDNGGNDDDDEEEEDDGSIVEDAAVPEYIRLAVQEEERAREKRRQEEEELRNRLNVRLFWHGKEHMVSARRTDTLRMFMRQVWRQLELRDHLREVAARHRRLQQKQRQIAAEAQKEDEEEKKEKEQGGEAETGPLNEAVTLSVTESGVSACEQVYASEGQSSTTTQTVSSTSHSGEHSDINNKLPEACKKEDDDDDVVCFELFRIRNYNQHTHLKTDVFEFETSADVELHDLPMNEYRCYLLETRAAEEEWEIYYVDGMSILIVEYDPNTNSLKDPRTMHVRKDCTLLDLRERIAKWVPYAAERVRIMKFINFGFTDARMEVLDRTRDAQRLREGLGIYEGYILHCEPEPEPEPKVEHEAVAKPEATAEASLVPEAGAESGTDVAAEAAANSGGADIPPPPPPSQEATPDMSVKPVATSVADASLSSSLTSTVTSPAEVAAATATTPAVATTSTVAKTVPSTAYTVTIAGKAVGNDSPAFEAYLTKRSTIDVKINKPPNASFEHSLSIDARWSIQHLRAVVAKKLGFQPEELRMFKQSLRGQELKDGDTTVAASSVYSGMSLAVSLGSATPAGHYNLTFVEYKAPDLRPGVMLLLEVGPEEEEVDCPNGAYGNSGTVGEHPELFSGDASTSSAHSTSTAASKGLAWTIPVTAALITTSTTTLTTTVTSATTAAPATALASITEAMPVTVVSGIATVSNTDVEVTTEGGSNDAERAGACSTASTSSGGANKDLSPCILEQGKQDQNGQGQQHPKPGSGHVIDMNNDVFKGVDASDFDDIPELIDVSPTDATNPINTATDVATNVPFYNGGTQLTSFGLEDFGAPVDSDEDALAAVAAAIAFEERKQAVADAAAVAIYEYNYGGYDDDDCGGAVSAAVPGAAQEREEGFDDSEIENVSNQGVADDTEEFDRLYGEDLDGAYLSDAGELDGGLSGDLAFQQSAAAVASITGAGSDALMTDDTAGYGIPTAVVALADPAGAPCGGGGGGGSSSSSKNHSINCMGLKDSGGTSSDMLNLPHSSAGRASPVMAEVEGSYSVADVVCSDAASINKAINTLTLDALPAVAVAGGGTLTNSLSGGVSGAVGVGGLSAAAVGTDVGVGTDGVDRLSAAAVGTDAGVGTDGVDRLSAAAVGTDAGVGTDGVDRLSAAAVGTDVGVGTDGVDSSGSGAGAGNTTAAAADDDDSITPSGFGELMVRTYTKIVLYECTVAYGNAIVG